MEDPRPGRKTAILWLAIGAWFFLLNARLFGYEFFVVALALSILGFVLVVGPLRAPGGRSVFVLASAVALVVAMGGAGLGFGAVVVEPRLVGSGDWVACAEIATVGPEEAIRTVVTLRGLDWWEIHTGVRPVFLNDTGGEFEVTCPGTPMIGAIRSRVPPPHDGLDHFAWLVGYSHDYELLAGLAWIDWDTGACVSSC